MPTCYKHPTRETGVSCSNCGRPICPDCMTPTSVGMRCPECAGERTRVHRMPTGNRGAALAPNFAWYDPRTWSATYALIIINVAVFFAELATGVTIGGGNDHGWVIEHGWLFGPQVAGHNPIHFSGLSGTSQYWRLLTSGFLHESLLHIGMNMLSLWFVGRSLEPAIGKAYFTAIYFAALLAGSFGALAFQPLSTTLGASGAIFGVFGALIAIAHARRIPLWQTGLLPMLLLNFVFTLTVPGVSIGGHLGGVIAGLICGRAVVVFGEQRGQPRYVYGICLLVAAVSIVGAILVANGGGTGLLPGGVNI